MKCERKGRIEGNCQASALETGSAVRLSTCVEMEEVGEGQGQGQVAGNQASGFGHAQFAVPVR